MSDRELLELAVKACQWTLEYDDNERLSWIIWSDNNVPIYRWNPLTDDGDALRLAVKLDIELYQANDDGPCVYAGYWGKPERRDVTRIFAIEPLEKDPYAATRRAIVRAAAEIGKGMK